MMKKLIKHEHLFSEKKLIEMKIQLKELENKLKELDRKDKKGFGVN